MSKKQFLDLNPHTRILLGPGPGMVAPRVIRALTAPPVGHLDPDLLAIYKEEQELLRYVFQTKNEWTFSLSGTGTSGMEAAMTNLVEPGDNVLVAIIGYFGERLAEIATRMGGTVEKISKPLGEIFEVSEIESALIQKPYKVFALVHAETSTGAEQLHIKEIVETAHRHGALVVMDTVTSLSSIPLKVDEWEVDIAYSASQKGLGAPSGLAPITISPRAKSVIEKRNQPVTSFYLDLKQYANYWEKHDYHHTASASLHYALREALRLIYEEGLENVQARMRKNAQLLWSGLEEIGVDPFIPLEYRLPPLATAKVPEGVDPHELRVKLLSEYNIEIASGFGSLKNQVWRIGLMGYSSRVENIILFLAAMEQLLAK